MIPPYELVQSQLLNTSSLSLSIHSLFSNYCGPGKRLDVGDTVMGISLHSTSLYAFLVTCSVSVPSMKLLTLWWQAACLSCSQGLGDCKDSITVSCIREQINAQDLYCYITNILSSMTSHKNRPKTSELFGGWGQGAQWRDNQLYKLMKYQAWYPPV